MVNLLKCSLLQYWQKRNDVLENLFEIESIDPVWWLLRCHMYIESHKLMLWRIVYLSLNWSIIDFILMQRMLLRPATPEIFSINCEFLSLRIIIFYIFKDLLKSIMIIGHKITSTKEGHIKVLLRIFARNRDIIWEKTISFSVFDYISIKVYWEIRSVNLLHCNPESILGCEALLFQEIDIALGVYAYYLWISVEL